MKWLKRMTSMFQNPPPSEHLSRLAKSKKIGVIAGPPAEEVMAEVRERHAGFAIKINPLATVTCLDREGNFVDERKGIA
jgi:hypothetical protein